MARRREDYGGSVFDQQHFSDEELARAAAIRAAAERGETDWASAHAYVEGIRKGYGYSGDRRGDQFRPLPGGIGGGLPKFEFAPPPTYVNKHREQINSMSNALFNRPKFSYDAKDDPNFQQYKKSYLREGERAMEDTLADAASLTGGVPSSAAIAASQQANNVYTSRLADKIPELQQLAYGMYMDEGAEKRQNLDMLLGMERNDFQEFLASLDQYNKDRGFAYGVHRDGISDQRYADETEYNRGRDTIMDSRYEKEQSRKDMLTKAELLAAAGDFSGYKALGLTDDNIALMNSAYKMEQSRKQSNGKKGNGQEQDKRMDYEGLFQAAKDSGYPESFISNNYKEFGFSSSSGLKREFDKWAKGQGNEENSKNKVSTSGGKYTPPNVTQGMAQSDFDAFYRMIRNDLNSGQVEAVKSKVYGQPMSASQKEKIQELINSYKG